ncbi:hypothetical protein KY338_04550 [Candidatus Woesearchaeota archaeon]|nr:hypothetical protein [Candidatus Woesearchaeota archaeon]MBW3005751.1 hypothetical protein [Candidatus Woesearchaeota archaeon]
MDNRQSILILAALVLVVAVSGFILKLSITGQYVCAGGCQQGVGVIQYSYPEEACEYVPCQNGHAIFSTTVGGVSPWDTYQQLSECYCPEKPEQKIYIPMVHPMPQKGMYLTS